MTSFIQWFFPHCSPELGLGQAEAGSLEPHFIFHMGTEPWYWGHPMLHARACTSRKLHGKESRDFQPIPLLSPCRAPAYQLSHTTCPHWFVFNVYFLIWRVEWCQEREGRCAPQMSATAGADSVLGSHVDAITCHHHLLSPRCICRKLDWNCRVAGISVTASILPFWKILLGMQVCECVSVYVNLGDAVQEVVNISCFLGLLKKNCIISS